jgi:DNA-binding NarL/FixJ family response regulator
VICEASDGLEAVQKAEELQPDLIVLDLGLPKLNGLEAARQIRKLSPNSKILFLSQESSADVVQEALGLGAFAYVVKSDAGNELLTAVNAVLRSEKFVSSRFADHDSNTTSDAQGRESFRRNNAARTFANTRIKLTRARR